MSKEQFCVTHTIDGVDYIFHRSAAGKLTCEPVNLEKFESYIESVRALGPDGIQAKLREVRGVTAEDTAWREAAEKRMDALRRERAAELVKEYGVYYDV